MICHKHKCIFIHIQRTGGTALERIITGKDWFHDRSTMPEKHVIASQAKELYKDYWNDYFKFSIVRNPWSRIISMLRFEKSNHFGVKLVNSKVDISGYKKIYGYEDALEYDHRFCSLGELPKPKKGMGYSNILNKELDFIGKYENLEEDFNYILSKIGSKEKIFFTKGENKLYNSTEYQDYYTKETKSEVEEMYKHDNETYGYKF